MRSRAKQRPRLIDLLEADATVICLETFRPGVVARLVERGEHRRLNDPIVARFPAQFALIVPLERLDDLREIER